MSAPLSAAHTAKLREAAAYLEARGLTKLVERDGWYIRERVSRPYAVSLRNWASTRQAAGMGMRTIRHGVPKFRSFAAGENTWLSGAWSGTELHVNQSLYRNLRALRARTADLARNNDYARYYLGLVKENVAGPNGVALQVQARKRGGDLDKNRSDLIEDEFRDWGGIANCTTNGRLSWLDVQRLWIETAARAGEVLVQRVRGRGKYGYAIKLLDPALLDESYCDDLANGNRIRMSIELDRDERVVAYWLSTADPSDPRRMLSTSGGERTRVPAEEIWHDFVPEWIGQLRGVPWMATTVLRQRRLGEWEAAAIAAAEEGAKKLAWIQSPGSDLSNLADQVDREAETSQSGGADEPVGGTLYTSSEQGIHYAQLGAGQEVVNWDPKYPDAAVGPFRKEILRGIASGMRVNYHKLGSDLADVNFSSARGGELVERDFWKGLQNWMIERLHARVYAEWLPLAVLTGQLDLPFEQLERFPARWQPRGWDWVNPKDDVAAIDEAIRIGITSRRREILRRGEDPDEVFEEWQREQEQFAAMPAAPAADPIPPVQITNNLPATTVAAPAVNATINVPERSVQVDAPISVSIPEGAVRVDASSTINVPEREVHIEHRAGDVIVDATPGDQEQLVERDAGGEVSRITTRRMKKKRT